MSQARSGKTGMMAQEERNPEDDYEEGDSMQL